MIARLLSFSVQARWFALLLTAVVGVFGLYEVTRLPIDARALRSQRSDVAIERSQADVELCRQSRSAHRIAMPVENLDECKKTLGT